jgi:hypothetical protein
MGMDVIGTAPTSERGTYFCNNIHWWHPLAIYCQQVAPEIASGCRNWHMNDGDELDADAARARLPTRLPLRSTAERPPDSSASGMPNLRPCRRKPALAARASAPCLAYAGGTDNRSIFSWVIPAGFTVDPDHPMIDGPSRHPCPHCSGEGIVREGSMIAGNFHPFSVENVQGFVAFLRDCGGVPATRGVK